MPDVVEPAYLTGEIETSAQNHPSVGKRGIYRHKFTNPQLISPS